MDFFFCIPLALGCPTKINPVGDLSPRVCPRCNNSTMFSAKSRTWFEFCFVPLFPISTKHIWFCSICQCRAAMESGWEPQIAPLGYHHQPGFHQPGYPQSGYPQSGYHQAYVPY